MKNRSKSDEESMLMETLAKRNVFVITGLEEELDNSFLSGSLLNYWSRIEEQVGLQQNTREDMGSGC